MKGSQSIFRAAFAALLCVGGAGSVALAKEGALWGSRNLIADPKVEAGDIVTIAISSARSGQRRGPHVPARETPEAGEDAPPAAAAPAAGEAGRLRAETVAARVVKRLPNGNLVLEAKVRLGRGYILIGGEIARGDLRRGRGTTRTVDIARLAKLAVVARGLDAEILTEFMRSLTRLGRQSAQLDGATCGLGAGEFRLASGGPAGPAKTQR